ncbi:unnamed protein product [Arabidopsis halleri]
MRRTKAFIREALGFWPNPTVDDSDNSITLYGQVSLCILPFIHSHEVPRCRCLEFVVLAREHRHNSLHF